MVTRPLTAEPLPRQDPRPDPRRLTGRLRSTRLTVLRVESEVERSDWLRASVMPLLQRRANDSPIACGGLIAKVLPFPERRCGLLPSAEATPPFEVAVLIDRWDGAPLQALQVTLSQLLCIQPQAVAAAGDTLGARLAALAKRLGARFLLLFDRFEELLAAANSNSECGRFLDELAEGMRTPHASVHVLLCATDRAAEPLAAYLHGCPTADAEPLRLADLLTVADLLDPTSHSPRPPVYLVPPAGAPARGSVAGASMFDSDWLASVDDLLARVADEARKGESVPSAAPETAPANPVEPTPTAAPTSAAWAAPFALMPPATPQPAPAREPQQPLVPPDPPRSDATRGPIQAAVAAALAALMVGAGLWWGWPRSDNGPAARPDAVATAQPPPRTAVETPRSNPMTAPATMSPTPAAKLTPPPAAAPSALLDLAVDADEGGLSRLADDLARIAPFGLRVTRSSGWADSVAAPRLALLRYDALENLHRQRPNAALRLVAPLLVEELHFIVRADSPLQHVHDIEGATINTGPASGSRALTVQTVYQRLFNRSLPASQTSVADRDEALHQLLDTRSVDVIVVAEAQPSDWLATLPAERAAAIKLLPLEPAHPASRRALRAYLPATLRAGSALPSSPSIASLGVMSFLVVSGPPNTATAGRSTAKLKRGNPPSAVAPTDAQLSQLSRSLCRSLLPLQRDGHPKWRDWRPGLQLPAAWPYIDPEPMSPVGAPDCPS